MNKMKVTMQEVRTVLEGALTNGGNLSLDFRKVGDTNPDVINISASIGNTYINGGYYVQGDSFTNININGFVDGVGLVLDEIHKQCKAVLVVEPEVKVGK
ncbi:hypothetical protein [Myroides marinus]|uniref:hypothetical protein n=1 Tax=Myroides marinus TaxID=703342 RepID=UPI0025781BF6|nr:hypothetical protein [Myroides marinus]MDM1345693.1 hypothetical protein [Myroides marinus]MDM1378825.1 hypothetical protein [Myroides marinus]MDM1386096.1 hypothetical protein [Myroides marinus]MDM1393309.1 hypothetical protein [Myroides marinus]